MKAIQLRPHNMRNESIIMIQFPYDKELISRAKTIENTLSSQYMFTWYMKKSEFKLNRIFKIFKRVAYVDYLALKTTKTLLL